MNAFCSVCKRLYEIQDPRHVPHSRVPEVPLCQDCLFKRNMEKLEEYRR